VGASKRANPVKQSSTIRRKTRREGRGIAVKRENIRNGGRGGMAWKKTKYGGKKIDIFSNGGHLKPCHPDEGGG